jgi:voltage-gated potassium channel
MKLKDRIATAVERLRQWVTGIDWKQVARRIARFLNRVMHKILFEWLMPKKYRGLKKREIFEIIFKSDTPAGKKFDVWLLVAIVANIVVLIVDSLSGSTSTMVDGLTGSWGWWIIKVLEWGFTLLFTFEYYLRVYCLKRPLKYVFSFWGIIDFLSIFPAYLSLVIPTTQALTVLRLLRVMRIFRIFRMSRFQAEAYHLLEALKNSAIKILIFMLFMLVAAVILGTMMYSFEAEHNPNFDSVLTGVYWAVVTITTVGYGDVAPVTGAGRFLAVLVMLLGYSIIAVPTGIVVGETIAESRRPDRKPKLTAVQRDYDDEEEDEAIKN